MDKDIFISINDSIKALEKLKKESSLTFIKKAVFMIADAFEKGNKIIIAGNGGSLCDAMHFAEEFTGFYRKNRKALPAIVLSEMGHLTCIGNDIGFEHVFSRGVEAHGKKGDVFIALTTSGNSENLINALDAAKKRNLHTISFLGKTGGKMKGQSDLELIIDDFKYSDRIQEAHMTAIHIIIEMVERKLNIASEEECDSLAKAKEFLKQKINL